MDLPVLKYLDVLIGLALVMLIVATVALSISHALLDLLDSRARHLSHALARLVHQVHPGVLAPHAADIARLVQLHPLVCMPHGPISGLHNRIKRALRWLLPARLRPWLPAWLARYVVLMPRQPARVVLREELALCLLEWASTDGGWSMAFDGEPAAAAAQRRTALVRALRERGIEDPAATLRAVKLQAMANERDHPDQPAEIWRSQALAQSAPSEFLSGLYVAFDNTMNRATATFGREAQVWVSAVALVIVVVAQLDAFHLVKRLSVDEAYRTALVAEAQQLTEAVDAACGEGKTGTPGCQGAVEVAQTVVKVRGGACADSLPQPERAKCEVKASAALLSAPTLDLWPRDGAGPPFPGWDWTHPIQSGGAALGWLPSWLGYLAPKLPGILLAWILVSLGAPFWYDLLKNLFQLRSLLAQKDDADRGERAAGTKPTATIEVNKGSGGAAAAANPAGAAAPGPVVALAGRPQEAALEVEGEMGDLLATGAQG